MVDWSNLEVNTFRTAGSVFKKHPSAIGKRLEITVVSCQTGRYWSRLQLYDDCLPWEATSTFIFVGESYPYTLGV